MCFLILVAIDFVILQKKEEKTYKREFGDFDLERDLKVREVDPKKARKMVGSLTSFSDRFSAGSSKYLK